MRYLILISLLFFTTIIWSQNFVFEKITTREGLSQNDVNDIYQDKSGFLWIGTNDGLNRYDGYNFKTYRINPNDEDGISSNLIFKLSEDIKGNLWIATSDEGVCKFDIQTNKFTAYRNTPETPDLLSSNQIIQILPTKSGQVWLGTNLGINILTEKNDEISVKKINTDNNPVLSSNNIATLKEDIYGRIWIGTRSGVFVYSEKEGIREIVPLQNNTNIKDIFIADNELYIANGIGVYRVRLNWETLTDFDATLVCNENANSILRTRDGHIYVSSNKGLFYVERDQPDRNFYKEPVNFKAGWEPNSLSKDRVISLFEDKSGIVWIGTFGGGLNKYNPKQKKFRHYKKSRLEGSLSNDKIRAIYEDRKNNIWIGTEGGGICFLPKSENKNFETGFKHVDVNSNFQNFAYSIIDLNDTGDVEVVVGAGYPSVVQKMEIVNNSPQVTNPGVLSQINNSPFTIVKDSNGAVWFGTYGMNGLYKYYKDENGEHIENFRHSANKGALSSNTIRSLLNDSEGNLWIGTDNGLNLLTAQEQKDNNPEFIVFQHDANNPTSISHDYILPIFQAKDGTIWIGTMGGGLNRMMNSMHPDSIYFERITVEDGLPNNVIKAILEDDYGFLWISSNNGITNFDVQDKIFKNYDVTDGLQDNEFGELAACKLSDGEMLFGGVNGLNAFFPRDIVSDMSSPTIAITNFHILNKEVLSGEKRNGRIILENDINHVDKIRLKYSENSFAIYFSSLHFSAPGKNMYKYKLEGFEEEWIRKDASDRIAKYTNLRSGKYTFKIQGSNNDGVWSDSLKEIEITITPPWYFSITAWLIYTGLFIVLLWFFQRYSLIRIQQKNELLMEHFEKEKVQELSQMKLRFFTNISHEFRTPLTLIIGPLEKLMNQGSALSEKKIADSYSIMHRNASILLRLINQLIDFRKFEQGKMKLRASNTNLISFLREVFLSFTELAENRNINYSFSTLRDDVHLWFDDDKLERIMYNLLSNAFKFTSEGGEIDLIVDEDEYDVVISVSDNGVGIPKEMQAHIFERFYQTERIKNRKVGSTGIGLSFIKGLVEMHKGEISFESEEDKGTTFILKLKKGNAHLQEEQMREVTREKDLAVRNFGFLEPVKIEEDEAATKDISRYKVLLVEDNFELQQFVKDSLSDKYKIFTAENGRIGLERVEEVNPDVVVSDIMMPVMNGFELCESIKSDEKISHIPLVLLTAKSTAENRIKGYNLGADGYISKPFSIEVLEARIQNLIESREKLRKKLRTTITVEPSEVTTTSMDEKFLQRVLRIIEENIPNSEFTVEQLAGDYGMSQIALNKKLKGLTGQTAKAFIRTIRLKRAAQLFATGKYSVTDVTYEVGFSDLKYFRTCFKDEFALSPSEYTKKHRPTDN